MKNIIEMIGLLSTIISLVFAGIQIVQKKELKTTMKSTLQTHFNTYYQIARACTRARSAKDDKNLNEDLIQQEILNQLSIIQGASDVARTNIISYSRDQLGFTPYYEHPAFPGRDMSDDIKLGKQPEIEDMNRISAL